MNELYRRFGLADTASVDEKMAKFAAEAEKGCDKATLTAMAEDLDKHGDHEAAKAMSSHFRQMAQTMADPAQENRQADQLEQIAAEERAEAQAMSALTASLRARGVAVPDKAPKAVLMSLAALNGAPQVDVEKLVEDKLAKREAAAAAAAEKQERASFVKMARDAKAPEHEIEALNLLPIGLARTAAQKFGAAVPGHTAPAHLMGRMTGAGRPLNAPQDGAGGKLHTFSAPTGVDRGKGPQKFGGKYQVTLIGDTFTAAAEYLADCKDPSVVDDKGVSIMSRIDRAIGSAKGTPAEAVQRLLAAEPIVRELRPDLDDAFASALSA